MRKLLAVCLILASAIGTNAEENVAPKVEAYLNSLSTMTADFSQVDAYGNIAGGKFQLQRPGKFRWEYDKRQPVLIVSDGKQLVYYDKQLNEVTYTKTENTLANFLAQERISFSGDVKLLDSGRENGRVFVEVGQIDKPQESSLKMFFSENSGTGPLQIESLEVKDGGGNVTRVSFSNQVFGTQIAADTFKFRNPKFHKDAWEN